MLSYFFLVLMVPSVMFHLEPLLPQNYWSPTSGDPQTVTKTADKVTSNITPENLHTMATPIVLMDFFSD